MQKPNKRSTIPQDVRIAVLTEAGYRCAVPTCRTILAIDLHHIVHVAKGGANSSPNLLALCPTCHALYHRGIIDDESIRAWKLMLMTLTKAFDAEAIESLRFLSQLQPGQLPVSGDGVLEFKNLMTAGLAQFKRLPSTGSPPQFDISLTNRGRDLIDAWEASDLNRLTSVLTPKIQAINKSVKSYGR
ncbi:MAG: HNH endonuclease [Planctomycetes bacterium]|nr:HNH endonuclease [Planctomycetota bacterium]